MKLEFKLNLDSNGRPCIKFRHYDKDDSLEQKALGIFINAIEKGGVKIVNTSGFLSSEGLSWENYELQIDSNINKP